VAHHRQELALGPVGVLGDRAGGVRRGGGGGESRVRARDFVRERPRLLDLLLELQRLLLELLVRELDLERLLVQPARSRRGAPPRRRAARAPPA
jgi:hypothetical protein